MDNQSAQLFKKYIDQRFDQLRDEMVKYIDSKLDETSSTPLSNESIEKISNKVRNEMTTAIALSEQKQLAHTKKEVAQQVFDIISEKVAPQINKFVGEVNDFRSEMEYKNVDPEELVTAYRHTVMRDFNNVKMITSGKPKEDNIAKFFFFNENEAPDDIHPDLKAAHDKWADNLGDLNN